MLLVEQVDRLSRLTDSDWRKLRAELDARQVRVVALDLPTSWQLAAAADEFTARIFAALNAMMLDLLAAVDRKDYEDRRRRQAQGVAKAKTEGKYRGRPEDTDRNAGIAAMPRSGLSWTAIQAATGCSLCSSGKCSPATIRKTQSAMIIKRCRWALHDCLTGVNDEAAAWRCGYCSEG